MKRLSLLVLALIGINAVVNAQTFLRADFSFGQGRILGVDIKDMENNNCFSVGVLVEKIASNERGQYHFGLRYRHLQATTYTTMISGVEKYTYDYLEAPLYAELDLFQWFDQSLRFGPDFGVFGAVPVNVQGERTGQDALIWSRKYERPWFIFGFQVGGHAGLHFAGKFSAKVGYYGQFPFIPIVGAAPPDTYTGPEYKVHMIGMRGWQFSVSYCLD